MARSKSTRVDHALWGWCRQTQLILVIIAMFGSTSQVCAQASTLKVCQDWLRSSRYLDHRGTKPYHAHPLLIVSQWVPVDAKPHVRCT